MVALKPTIYKIKVALSDTDRNVYDALQLTVAQHPSENLERMMARVVAFCLNAEERLAFTKGLSTPDEPDIWARTLDDQLALWIDVGEPDPERIKKATRVAKTVKVYSFNSKSDAWWSLEHKKFSALSAQIFRFPWEQVQTLAALTERTMDLSATISGGSVYIASAAGGCEISCEPLQTS